MGGVSRRRLLAGGLGLGAAAALGGCDVLRMPGVGGGHPARARRLHRATPPPASATTTSDDDGSWTEHLDPQPHQPTPEKLGPGDTPPQLVVISWDGAGESPRLPLLSHFRGVAQELNASMTLFLSWHLHGAEGASGPSTTRPAREPGASAIPFFPRRLPSTRRSTTSARRGWRGTRSAPTSTATSVLATVESAAGRRSSGSDEIDQAGHVRHDVEDDDRLHRPARRCRSTTARSSLGGRTPCLEGSTNLLHYRETSSAGATTPARPAPPGVAPARPARCGRSTLQSIPFAGHNGSRCSRWTTTSCTTSREPPERRPAAKRDQWQQEATDTYVAGFKRAYDGEPGAADHRQPLRGLERRHLHEGRRGRHRKMAMYPDTRFVSFRQLCDYLDALGPRDPDPAAEAADRVGAVEGLEELHRRVSRWSAVAGQPCM